VRAPGRNDPPTPLLVAPTVHQEGARQGRPAWHSSQQSTNARGVPAMEACPAWPLHNRAPPHGACLPWAHGSPSALLPAPTGQEEGAAARPGLRPSRSTNAAGARGRGGWQDEGEGEGAAPAQQQVGARLPAAQGWQVLGGVRGG